MLVHLAVIGSQWRLRILYLIVMTNIHYLNHIIHAHNVGSTRCRQWRRSFRHRGGGKQ